MRSVPDSNKLSEMSIPGTHDSYANICGGSICGWVKTQTWSVPKQLKKGIRFFDVRLRPINGVLAIHHSHVFLHKYFGDALNDFKYFLQRNPSETILVRYKDETRHNSLISAVCKDGGQNCFKKVLKEGYEDKWMRSNSRYIYKGSTYRIPTLGETRGKIVFINMDRHGDFGLTNLNVRDDFEIARSDRLVDCGNVRTLGEPCIECLIGAHLETEWRCGQSPKLNGIKRHLNQASDNQQLSLTFCSGVGNKWVSPNSIYWAASNVNEYVKKLIRSYPRGKKLGVVIFDYVDIAESVVNDMITNHND